MFLLLSFLPLKLAESYMGLIISFIIELILQEKSFIRKGMKRNVQVLLRLNLRYIGMA